MHTELAVQTSANYEKISTISYQNVDELSAAVAIEIAALIRANDKLNKPYRNSTAGASLFCYGPSLYNPRYL